MTPIKGGQTSSDSPLIVTYENRLSHNLSVPTHSVVYAAFACAVLSLNESSTSIRVGFKTATLPFVPLVQLIGGAPPSIILRANWSSVSRRDWPNVDTALFNTVCYSPCGGNGHFCHSPDLSSSGPDYRIILTDAFSLSLSRWLAPSALSP